MSEATTPDTPRFAPVSAEGLGRLLLAWLHRPQLTGVTLVAFAIEPNVSVPAKPQRFNILDGVERLLPDVSVTVVTASPDDPRRAERLRRLAAAGANVFIHPTLHAKVFLFEEDSRVCWVVGSSNLTAGGVARNEELNLRGFHREDFKQVAEAARELLQEAVPL
jgi:phosphatidylserine/phosphatidylglycerophosphate/cardiolipin synthase-like enzyme